MSESPKQPKIIPSGNFKATDKPVQYNFVLHQDKKKPYQPRHSVPAGKMVTSIANQSATPQSAQATPSVAVTTESTTEINWFRVAIALTIVAGLLYLAIKYWYWVVFILLMVGSLLLLLWLFSFGSSGGGGGSYGDSWQDGYNAGYDEYHLWHDNDNNDWW
jgi:hypothetical protein